MQEYILILAVGKRNSGKTTMSFEVARQSKKPIVVIKQGYHPAYDNWHYVTIENIKNIDSDCCIDVNEENINECCTQLMKYQKNLFIVFEDCAGYIPQNINRGGLKNIVIDLRKHGFDLLFMYHSLRFVPPFLAQMYNCLLLFKTVDSFDNATLSKYPNAATIRKAGEQINKHKNPHYCKMIMDNE